MDHGNIDEHGQATREHIPIWKYNSLYATGNLHDSNTCQWHYGTAPGVIHTMSGRYGVQKLPVTRNMYEQMVSWRVDWTLLSIKDLLVTKTTHPKELISLLSDYDIRLLQWNHNKFVMLQVNWKCWLVKYFLQILLDYSSAALYMPKFDPEPYSPKYKI